jgi:hypothetical protein
LLFYEFQTNLVEAIDASEELKKGPKQRGPLLCDESAQTLARRGLENLTD